MGGGTRNALPLRLSVAEKLELLNFLGYISKCRVNFRKFCGSLFNIFVFVTGNLNEQSLGRRSIARQSHCSSPEKAPVWRLVSLDLHGTPVRSLLSTFPVTWF